MEAQLVTMREQAVNKIQVGERDFQNKNSYQDKLKAKELMSAGIQELLNYLHYETNVQIKNVFKSKIADYIEKVSQMKMLLQQSPDYKNDTSAQTTAKPSNPYMTQQNQPKTYPKYEPNKNNQGNTGDGNQNSNKQQGQEENKEQQKFEDALSQAIVTEKPNVKWDDVAGLVQAKRALQEAVILPTKFPEIFDGIRKPWKGILLYGPPGTGKTFLAKACATECNATFFSVSSSDLVSKYVGESAKLIRTLFQMARKEKPSIIFIDEIDSLAGSRDSSSNDASKSVVTEFLVQMQGVGKDDQGVLVLAATNIPWGLDAAIRRRFEKRIYISLPEEQARRNLLAIQLKKTQHSLTDEEIDKIAQQTDGFSGADLSNLIKDAAYQPLRQAQSTEYFEQITIGNQVKFKPASQPSSQTVKMKFYDLAKDQLYIPPINYKDFMDALKNIKKSVSAKDLTQHEQFTKDFGQDG